MPRLYTFLDVAGEERMVPVGWILHLCGRWYLGWLLVVVFALALCKLANDDREDI